MCSQTGASSREAATPTSHRLVHRPDETDPSVHAGSQAEKAAFGRYCCQARGSANGIFAAMNAQYRASQPIEPRVQ